MPTVHINATFLRSLSRTDAPAREVKFHDSKLPGFHIRHLPSGRSVYALQLRRGVAKTLGVVSSFKDSDAARDFAIDLLSKHRKGENVRVQRPDKPSTPDGVTVVSVFGLRKRDDSTTRGRRDRPRLIDDVVGTYRTMKRRGRRSIGARETSLDLFVQHVGRSLLFSELTVDHCTTFADALITTSRNRRTAAEHLSTVRTALRFAKRKGYISTNPLADIRIERGADDAQRPIRWLTPDEEIALRTALRARDARMRAAQDLSTGSLSRPFAHARRREWSCKFVDHLEPIVLLALNTGGRRTALFSLQWRHIESLPYPRVMFEGTTQKAGQTYYVPLNKEMRDVLRAWKPADARPGDYVFPSMWDEGKRLTSVARVFGLVLKAAGIVNFRFHDLRHTFASKLVQRGVSLYAVSKLMGHSDQRMTARYAHMEPRGQFAHVDLLNTPLPAFVPPVDDAA